MLQSSTTVKRALRVGCFASSVAVATLAGCSSEPDPNRYFNAATDGPRLQACLAKLGPMVADIQRKGLDQGEYRPGSQITVKNLTFRYYQALVWKQGYLQRYLGWDKLSLKQKNDLGPFLGCHEVENFTTHEAAIATEIADTERLFKTKLPRESLEDIQAAGRKSLDEADEAIRAGNAQTAKRLQAASVHHAMSNRNGVRIDTYTLKDGRSVICSTTVRGSSPPLMDCDGEP